MNTDITFSTKRKLEDYLLDLFCDFAIGREIEDYENMIEEEKFSIIKYTALSELCAFNRFLSEDKLIETIEKWFLGMSYPVEIYNYKIKEMFDLDSDTYWRALAEIVYYNG